jgi:hypothetical protein
MEIYNNLENFKRNVNPYLDVNQNSKIKYAEAYTYFWLIDDN